jgi:hypothetical protein
VPARGGTSPCAYVRARARGCRGSGPPRSRLPRLRRRARNDLLRRLATWSDAPAAALLDGLRA